MAMNFAIVTGNAFDAYGPELRGPVGGSEVSFRPFDLEDGADIVLGGSRNVPLLRDGTLPPVHLWPGIWGIGLPGGVSVRTRLEAGVTYTLAQLRGAVPPVGAVWHTLEVPDTVTDGQLLARDGDNLLGVDPATLGGGGGAAAVPNFINGYSYDAAGLPGVPTYPDLMGFYQLAGTELAYFSPFILTVPGVATSFQMKLPDSGGNTSILVLYRLNTATGNLEVLERMGPFAQTGSFQSVVYGETLQPGIYYIATKLTVANTSAQWSPLLMVPGSYGRLKYVEGGGMEFTDTIPLSSLYPSSTAMSAVVMGAYA